MLSYATDGFYWPSSVAYRSLGGALGGCPDAPDAETLEPEVNVAELAPTMAAASFKPGFVRTADVELLSNLLTRDLKPSTTPGDDEDD